MRHGKTPKAGHGWARQGQAWRGLVWNTPKVRLGWVGLCSARCGTAGRGNARRVAVWPGKDHSAGGRLTPFGGSSLETTMVRTSSGSSNLSPIVT